jgi:hypothetical protein
MSFRKTSGVQIKGLNPVGSGLYWNELIQNEQRLHVYSPLAMRQDQPEVFVPKTSTSYNTAFVKGPNQNRSQLLAPAGKPSFYAKFDTPRREVRRYQVNAELQHQANKRS